MSKQRNIRKRRALDEQEELSDEDGQGGALSAEDVILLQKQRQRRKARGIGVFSHGSSGAPSSPLHFVWPQQYSVLIRRAASSIYVLQGVDATALAAPDAASGRIATTLATDDVNGDVLEAAFKRERQQATDEDDPHMWGISRKILRREKGKWQGLLLLFPLLYIFFWGPRTVSWWTIKL
jgi:hypothetical protein